MGNVFSVPIFIIVMRETIEAAIIVSVLLGLVESLVDKAGDEGGLDQIEGHEGDGAGGETTDQRKRRLIKRMRWQIWAGALSGLFIALCIGAAFIAVFFTTLSDIWSKAEEIWEGTFSLIACIIIFIMGLTMLRIDRSKLKWKKKLEGAFDSTLKNDSEITAKDRREARSSKWTLFLLPGITVLREGLEAVVFVGGVSLGQSARSIPLAAIVGLIVGFGIGWLIYISGSRMNLSIFLVVSTNILFLLGAGLLSKAVGDFQRHTFNQGVGSDVEEIGDGPGSYDVRGNVWHLTYGNPELNTSSEGWSVFNAILGWTNTATIGTILSYCFYWLLVIAAVYKMKYDEGRTHFFGKLSPAGQRRRAKVQRAVAEKEQAAAAGSLHEKQSRSDGESVAAPSLRREGSAPVPEGEAIKEVQH